jgi:hypothetical protein
MNNENLIEDQKAQEAMEAVSYLFAVAAEKSNPCTVTDNEFFGHYIIHQLKLNNEELSSFFILLLNAGVLRRESNIPNGVYRIDYTLVVNLIISSFEDSTKPKFLVLHGWENVVRQDSIPETVKEFLIAYQSFNVYKYFDSRVTSSGVIGAGYYYGHTIF